MAIFKILKGDSSRISLEKTPFNEGWAYFTPDNGGFYIDVEVDGVQRRIRVSTDAHIEIDDEPTASSEHAVTSGGVYTALGEKADLEDGKVKTDQLPDNLVLSDGDDTLDANVLVNADTLGGHTANYFAKADAIAQKANQEDVVRKQDKISGAAGQIVGFDQTGAVIAIDASKPGAVELDAATLDGHNADYFVTQEDVEKKQNKLSGEAGQVVGFDVDGNAIAQAAPVTGITQEKADERYTQKSTITYGTQDMTAGSSALPTGNIYLVYES